MADISKLNLGTGVDLELKDAYVRSLIPANADPNTNQLATMNDVGGGSTPTITYIDYCTYQHDLIKSNIPLTYDYYLIVVSDKVDVLNYDYYEQVGQGDTTIYDQLILTKAQMQILTQLFSSASYNRTVTIYFRTSANSGSTITISPLSNGFSTQTALKLSFYGVKF